MVRDASLRSAPRHEGLWGEAQLSLDNHVVVLDADRKRLGLVRPFDEPRSGFHRDIIAARLHLARIAPGLSGADVELPGMPRAADDLALAGVLVIARLG